MFDEIVKRGNADKRRIGHAEKSVDHAAANIGHGPPGPEEWANYRVMVQQAANKQRQLLGYWEEAHDQRQHLIKMLRAMAGAYGDGDFCSGCPLFGDSGCEAGVSLDIDRCEKTITAWADKHAGGEEVSVGGEWASDDVCEHCGFPESICSCDYEALALPDGG